MRTLPVIEKLLGGRMGRFERPRRPAQNRNEKTIPSDVAIQEYIPLSFNPFNQE